MPRPGLQSENITDETYAKITAACKIMAKLSDKKRVYRYIALDVAMNDLLEKLSREIDRR